MYRSRNYLTSVHISVAIRLFIFCPYEIFQEQERKWTKTARPVEMPFGSNPNKLYIGWRSTTTKDGAILWGFRLRSYPDLCKLRCNYKSGYMAAMRPYTKLLCILAILVCLSALYFYTRY